MPRRVRYENEAYRYALNGKFIAHTVVLNMHADLLKKEVFVLC